ncbi:Ig-like domain repeat protein [Halorarius halobius]|uniref:Ig-like domain repeat protein n=1 Tax=Halorarius halobius TaxID=2962671 RepID=UPI0020CF6E41|nr:Ig-like domain repeat protein [Halorarius halobius]
MSRSSLVALSCLVALVALTGPVAADAGSAAANATVTGPGTLDRTFTASLTPAEPGEIRVELRYTVPEGVTTLSTRLPEDATVRSTDGFQRRSGNTYSWTRTTDRPTVTYDLAVNRTVTRGIEGEATGGYLYVDAGPWAITPAPRSGVTYSGTGTRPELVTEYAFTGSGATSGDMLYLGPYEEHRQSAAGQRFRLVVPAAAEMASPPDAVLGSVTDAAESLSVGPRDPEVVAIAAPTSVEWGSTGLQRGESDFWVLATRGVDAPGNVWVHEYVHTQQAYRTTDAAEWTVEGFADYYAALLTYQQGRIDYDRYRRHLERGQRFDGSVLAEPETWGDVLVPYDKGALVAAALDRRIRLATDGGGSLQGVVRRLNGSADQSDLLAAVDAVGGDDSREYARRHTETDAVPETWSRQQHRAAFGGDRAAFAYEFVPPYERSGPYRTDAAGATPTVVVGESLRLRVAVENTGGAAGEYEAVLRANGRRVATRTGRLQPGGRDVLAFDRRFASPEDVRFTVARATERVSVRAPADVRVTGLDAPRRVTPGEQVRLRATVGNPAGRPANGTVTLSVDGRAVATERVRLRANGTATLTATTTLDAGIHRVTAGGRERTVRATTATPATATGSETVTAPGASHSPTEARTAPPTEPRTPTAGDGAGAGLTTALAALAALAVGRLCHRW